jgi:hypothetical protein
MLNVALRGVAVAGLDSAMARTEKSKCLSFEGPSASKAEAEAGEFLVNTRRVPSERIRTKIVRDAFHPSDPAPDYYLIKYEYSTCMGFFKAFWTEEKVFRFSDRTVELLNREPCEQSSRHIDDAVPWRKKCTTQGWAGRASSFLLRSCS